MKFELKPIMNSVERHHLILEKLKQIGNITVSELCEELGVSTVTIRKDLKFLEDSSLLFRVHGGATRQNPYTTDRPVFEKEKLHTLEKSKIGKTAASFVEPNDSIIIASGTTMQAMAKEIEPQGLLTVVTSALNVAQQLIQHQNVEIIQLGGTMRKTSMSVTGAYAETILKDFFCSKLFLGVDGIDMDFGITTTNAQEARLNRVMMESAQKVIVLVDSSKFGRKSFGKIAEINQIDILITDNYVNPRYVEKLESLGIKVIVV
ncbi:DeoR/GlpR transcriptional regulator [Sphingobacterium spiritivorum]|nr:DeoR/GlpR transcriptional regulator [Sphingobacterium spiritivorum]